MTDPSTSDDFGDEKIPPHECDGDSDSFDSQTRGQVVPAACSAAQAAMAGASSNSVPACSTIRPGAAAAAAATGSLRFAAAAAAPASASASSSSAAPASVTNTPLSRLVNGAKNDMARATSEVQAALAFKDRQSKSRKLRRQPLQLVPVPTHQTPLRPVPAAFAIASAAVRPTSSFGSSERSVEQRKGEVECIISLVSSGYEKRIREAFHGLDDPHEREELAAYLHTKTAAWAQQRLALYEELKIGIVHAAK